MMKFREGGYDHRLAQYLGIVSLDHNSGISC